MRLVFDQAFGLDEDSLHDVVATLKGEAMGPQS